MSETIIWPEGAYVVMAEMGYCKICHEYQDLRMGSCFDCSEQVHGKPIPGGHELWDSKDPSNRWKVQAS